MQDREFETRAKVAYNADMPLQESMLYPRTIPLQEFGFPPTMRVAAIRSSNFTLGGVSGTGKTTIAELMQKALGARLINVGEEFKQRIKTMTGKELDGNHSRSVGIDQQIDTMMQTYMRSAQDILP